MDNDAEVFFKNAVKSFGLSWRVLHRLMKLSRTIADMEKSEKISTVHIAECLQYRSKTMFVSDL
jgi:magnesium chelatase family protein